MGVPDSGMQAAEQPTAETLLTAFRTIKAPERQRHASVLDYWLSIRGNKEFPPLHDLDPLEISDAGPYSILLELIGGGQDAEIRHLGEALKADITVDRIIDAPNPSILGCIAKKLPIVAISRDFLAFEDSFDHAGGWTRLWVTLLPLSSCGSWVDYVYAFVSVETGGGKAAKPAPPAEAPVVEEVEVVAEPAIEEPETAEELVPLVAEEPESVPEETVEPVEAVAEPEPVEAIEDRDAPEPRSEADPESPEEGPTSGPGFSKLLEGIAHLTGFYGQGVKVADPVVQAELPPSEPPVSEPVAAEPEHEAEPAAEVPEAIDPPAELEEPAPADDPAATEQPADEPAEAVAPEDTAPKPAPGVMAEEPQPAPASEGALHSKLEQVRAKADEARQAALRATAALHEGLSAAYDFALDAETSPEEYLRLVETQGLKIQLRAPMAPVAKLAFDGLVDPATLGQCEKLLAWALKEELPRGELLERIDGAGGIAELLEQVSRPS